jgi:hypothetical protein
MLTSQTQRNFRTVYYQYIRGRSLPDDMLQSLGTSIPLPLQLSAPPHGFLAIVDPAVSPDVDELRPAQDEQTSMSLTSLLLLLHFLISIQHKLHCHELLVRALIVCDLAASVHLLPAR